MAGARLLPVAAGPADPVAAARHQRRHALDEAGEGDAARLEMLGQRSLVQLGSEAGEPLGRGTHGVARLRLRTDVLGEALGHDSDAQTVQGGACALDRADVVAA